jgi:teichuronic acid biosynthesis glycosyltransferase TuaC
MLNGIVVYSSLFPSAAHPVQGIFVAELVKAMTAYVSVQLVHPVVVHRAPQAILHNRRRRPESWGGIEEDPLCFNVPRFLKGSDARLMAFGSRRAFRRACDGANLVHAHYAYPDGAAASILAAERGLPLIITVHGSDINVLAETSGRRRHIQETLQRASGVVAVAKDLVRKVVALGVPARRVHHIPNGVDLAKFSPGNRAEARSRLGLPGDGHIVLGVGGLLPVKAYDRLVRALVHLSRDTSLVLVGDGPQRASIRRLVGELGLTDRVRLAGAVPHRDLQTFYRASNLLAISSHSEGWPTVIFEALACGTPVVANPVGGIPEALGTQGLGYLTEGNRPEEMARGIERALSIEWNVETLLRAARAHSWHEIARRYVTLFEEVLKAPEAVG